MTNPQANHQPLPRVAQAHESKSAAFKIVPIAEVPQPQILALLDHVFGTGHTAHWYRWKHIENPFGPSIGWAAINQTELLGIRLFMRWQLQAGDKVVRCVRPVDTATSPQSRRMGVFRALTEYALEKVVADPEIDLIFNTPNEMSRPGYARMGWTILPPLSHGLRLILPGRPVALTDDPQQVWHAFDQFPFPETRLCTERSANYAAWRYAPASGIAYRSASLQGAPGTNGIVYRVAQRRGIRLLIVNELFGAKDEQTELLMGAARRESALAVLSTMGAGSSSLPGKWLWRRGESVVAVRALKDIHPDPTRLDSWALALGDLEQII